MTQITIVRSKQVLLVGRGSTSSPLWEKTGLTVLSPLDDDPWTLYRKHVLLVAGAPSCDSISFNLKHLLPCAEPLVAQHHQLLISDEPGWKPRWDQRRYVVSGGLLFHLRPGRRWYSTPKTTHPSPTEPKRRWGQKPKKDRTDYRIPVITTCQRLLGR